MSIVDNTIAHLREWAPVFQGNVAGAADYAEGLNNGPGDSVSLPLPAAYVCPAGSTSDGNVLIAGGTLQYVRRYYGIVVELNAQGDRRGQAPIMQLDDIEKQIRGALVGWVPTDPGDCSNVGYAGYWFSGSHKLNFNRARLWWQFTFALDTQIDETDGWNAADEGVPLEAIELDGFYPPDKDMLTEEPSFVVHIPTQPGESLWDVDAEHQPRSIWDQGQSRWDRFVPGERLTPFVPGLPDDQQPPAPDQPPRPVPLWRRLWRNR